MPIYMDTKDVEGGGSATAYDEDRGKEILDIRKGPWTEEEDSILVSYIKNHGEGHWNFLAYSAGLKRTGKSCRLRWLNYLRPGIRRGNFTLQEQLKILELQFCWGNRWSKIAQHLHGRTDNDIKNYWRSRVQKQAKQLNCDVNSKEFRDMVRNVLMPRLAEKIRATTTGSPSAQPTPRDRNPARSLITPPAGISSQAVLPAHDHDKGSMGVNYNCLHDTPSNNPAPPAVSLMSHWAWPFLQNDDVVTCHPFGDYSLHDVDNI